jgi:hypothetical protein
MRRFLFPLGLGLLVLGGALAGYALFRDDEEAAAEPAEAAFLETGPCDGCPFALDSAEVQDRDGSTLFVFRGGWPATPGELENDVRLTANDLQLVLRPSGDGFQLARATRGGEPLKPAPVAAALRDGALLVNVADSALGAPVRFVLGLAEGRRLAARLPRSGELVWNGSGAPTSTGGDPTEPAEPQPPPAPEPEGETPREFAAALAAAFRGGDEAFLVDRLNDAVIELYGRDQCAAFVAGLEDATRRFEVRSVSDLQPYVYNPDGRSIAIPSAYAVDTRVTAEGETSGAELHFAPRDGELTWFADCGDPIS